MTNLSLIRSLSIALLGCMLSPLYGQSESALQKFFEGKIVVVRIDMPGSQKGVDVYPERADSIDWEEYRRELKKYGTALLEGQEATITLIKTKSKHIEFQLDGGGLGTFGSPVTDGSWQREEAYQNKVHELEQDRKNTPSYDDTEKRRLERELEKLKAERPMEERREILEEMERNTARERSSRLAGGSRFNIRYESRLSDGDKTPESAMAALSEYLDFPQEPLGGPEELTNDDIQEPFGVPEPITNDDIVKMAQAQLSISIIVTNMKSADSVKFDLSPEGLIALTDAGVDDRVIEAMVSKEPEYILRNFKTMMVDASRAKFFGHDELKGALGDNKDFQPLNITIVDNPAVADVVLEVSYTFPWDYPFSLKHLNTSIVVLYGNGSGPFSGPPSPEQLSSRNLFLGLQGAKSLARELVKLLRPYRVAPPQ